MGRARAAHIGQLRVGPDSDFKCASILQESLIVAAFGRRAPHRVWLGEKSEAGVRGRGHAEF